MSTEDSLQNYVDHITDVYLQKLRDERLEFDKNQIIEIKNLLDEWTVKLKDGTTQAIQTAILSQTNELDGSLVQMQMVDGVVVDIRDRQAKMLQAIQDAHQRQIDVLRVAISEERKQSAQAQLIFEQTLKTRYESMVDALHEKVRSEQEARVQRSLDSLERTARLEGERAKQSQQAQEQAQELLANKFKSIVSDLRRSWEEQEHGRAQQLEERLRSHYSVVLEHMEAQLKMALRLQDEADRQWLEDVEARNQSQLSLLSSFEEKCRRLYDGRLREYAEKTSQQIAAYEEQLLQAGSSLAAEKAQFESRMRRLKLACSRWKISYQKDVHMRYQEMTSVLEERYTDELTSLLQEISDVKLSLDSANRTIDMKEKEILKMQEVNNLNVSSSEAGKQSQSQNSLSSSIAAGAYPSGKTIRESLFSQWNELKTPVAERVDALVSLLDAAQATPQLMARYDFLQSKLADRAPIAQLISRRQFIEYKLKLASKMDVGGNSTTGGGVSSAERAAFISELTEIQSSLDSYLRQYEKKYGEKYGDNYTASSSSAIDPTLNTPLRVTTSLSTPISTMNNANGSKQTGNVKTSSTPAAVSFRK